MSFPAFFLQVPTITVHDPLAEFLGTAEGGVIEYGYPDAVRLAGHSCPTVAGAYLMTLKALAHLYGTSRPERGGVRVAVREAMDAGVAGVIGSVAGLITGAAGEGGFKGLGGRFVRRNLLSFCAAIGGQLRISRIDTGTAVEVDYHPEHVPPSAAMGEAFARAQSAQATAADRADFARLWQERVRRILLDHIDAPAVVTVSEV